MDPSNELVPSIQYTQRQLNVRYLSAQSIDRYVSANSINLNINFFFADITLVGIQSIGTPVPYQISTITVFPIHKDQVISGITIKSVIVIQLIPIQEGVLAETWLEGVYEYGVGENDTKAIEDLIISLNEYLIVLNKNRDTIGDSAKKELDALQRLIGAQASDHSGGH